MTNFTIDRRTLLAIGALSAAAAPLGVTLSTSTFAAEENPLAKYLAVPGAKTTLPVAAAKKPFSHKFVAEARKRFDNFHYQMGGDDALYYNMHLSELMPTATAVSPRREKPLGRAINAGVGKVKFPTKNSGVLTLDEYVVHPNHRVQGVMVLHHGKVVYEAYPGINSEQVHVWMSAAKTTVGLVIAQLEAEGKIDLSEPAFCARPRSILLARGSS